MTAAQAASIIRKTSSTAASGPARGLPEENL
jgi:hypothetical protein